MIVWKYKLWRTAGAAAVLGLAACGDNQTPTTTPTPPPRASNSGELGEAAIGEGGGESGAPGIGVAYAGVTGAQRSALRLQHLRGYLLAAERVRAGGDAAGAATLVQQGLTDAYDPAPTETGALDVAPLRAAAASATAVSLSNANAALDHARAALTDVDDADLIVRLIDLSTGLYQQVQKGENVDAIGYRHSYAAALAAQQALTAHADALRTRDARAYAEGLTEVNRFVALWPSATPPAQPAAYREVLAQGSRVRLALSPLL